MTRADLYMTLNNAGDAWLINFCNRIAKKAGAEGADEANQMEMFWISGQILRQRKISKLN